MTAEFVMYLDGACRGNPGPASAGVILHRPDGQIKQYGFYLGRATNNIAEYSALLKGLELMRDRLAKSRFVFYSDSQLLVRQIKGEYKVKDAGLKELWKEAQASLTRIPSWEIHHIPREENSEADRMANRALDEERDVTE